MNQSDASAVELRLLKMTRIWAITKTAAPSNVLKKWLPNGQILTQNERT